IPLIDHRHAREECAVFPAGPDGHLLPGLLPLDVHLDLDSSPLRQAGVRVSQLKRLFPRRDVCDGELPLLGGDGGWAGGSTRTAATSRRPFVFRSTTRSLCRRVPPSVVVTFLGGGTGPVKRGFPGWALAGMRAVDIL